MTGNLQRFLIPMEIVHNFNTSMSEYICTNPMWYTDN